MAIQFPVHKMDMPGCSSVNLTVQVMVSVSYPNTAVTAFQTVTKHATAV